MCAKLVWSFALSLVWCNLSLIMWAFLIAVYLTSLSLDIFSYCVHKYTTKRWNRTVDPSTSHTALTFSPLILLLYSEPMATYPYSLSFSGFWFHLLQLYSRPNFKNNSSTQSTNSTHYPYFNILRFFPTPYLSFQLLSTALQWRTSLQPFYLSLK